MRFAYSLSLRITADDVQHYKEKCGRDPVYHKGPNGIKEAIDQVFKDMDIPDDGSVLLTVAQKSELVESLCRLYQHDSRFSHLKLWPVTRDWLLKNTSIAIPNSVPPCQFHKNCDLYD